MKIKIGDTVEYIGNNKQWMGHRFRVLTIGMDRVIVNPLKNLRNYFTTKDQFSLDRHKVKLVIVDKKEAICYKIRELQERHIKFIANRVALS